MVSLEIQRTQVGGFDMMSKTGSTLLFAALVGTAIPLTLRRLGMDPALGGSILVTMFVDVMGVVFFLGLAHLSLSFIV